jgi:CHAD domain-containing protein
MGYGWSRHDRNFGAGFARIATEQMVKAVVSADDVDQPVDKRVHEARLHCKKLRALFRLVQPGFPDFAEADAAVRDAADCLSTARDARVIRQTLADLQKSSGLQLSAGHQPSDIERRALRRFDARMLKLARRVDGWAVAGIDPQTIGKGLRHTYTTAIRAGAAAKRRGTPEAFHLWRKATKYFAFQLLLVQPIAPEIIGPEMRNAEKLADVLGRYNDLAVLRVTARRDPGYLGEGIDIAALRTTARQRQNELVAAARILAAEVYTETPKTFLKRMRNLWATYDAAPPSAKAVP